MDPTKFDDLTKALATAPSRRQALKTIAATTIGGILGLAGIGTAFGAPKCHRAGLGCDTDSNCCSNVCCNGKCCASGQTCQNGQCCSGKPLGALCCVNSECCSGACDLTCVASCVPLGGTCTSPSDCCSVKCANGACVATCDPTTHTCANGCI
jgi:hypothetical protein